MNKKNTINSSIIIIIILLSYPIAPIASFASGTEQTALPNEERSTIPTSILESTSSWLGSIMFSTTELRKINKALESFGLGNSSLIEQGIEILQDSNLLSLTQQKKKVTPKFHLNSILYLSPSNWAIWINSDKITYDSKHNEFTVETIGQKSATISWKTPDLNKLSPNWQKKLSEVRGQIHYNSEKTIGYSKQEKKILFTLQPNQTIDIESMQIFEGTTK